MLLELLHGVLSLANAFIAFFIVIYAFLFLKQTRSHKERRPWDYLVVASVIYLAYTILLLVLAIYDVKTFLNLNLEELSVFFQFIYTGLILLAFISQTDLIFKNEIIIITRKMEPEKKKEIETKIEKEIEQELEIAPPPDKNVQKPLLEEGKNKEEGKPDKTGNEMITDQTQKNKTIETLVSQTSSFAKKQPQKKKISHYERKKRKSKL